MGGNPYSVYFFAGPVFRDQAELPDFFDPIRPYLNELKKCFVERPKLAQALLSFCLSKDYIDYVVVGVNNQHQLIENIKASLSYQGALPELPSYIPKRILLPYLWTK